MLVVEQHYFLLLTLSVCLSMFSLNIVKAYNVHRQYFCRALMDFFLCELSLLNYDKENCHWVHSRSLLKMGSRLGHLEKVNESKLDKSLVWLPWIDGITKKIVIWSTGSPAEPRTRKIEIRWKFELLYPGQHCQKLILFV